MENRLYVNRLRAAMTSGHAAFGTASAIPHPMAIEQTAKSGIEWLFIDMQHGLATFADLPPLFATLRSYGVTPIVRVPYDDYSGAQRALDAGAEGIIFPYIETAHEARRAVDACKYPPIGIRSFGPYWSPYGADLERANDQVLCIAMIESVAAMGRVDEILATPGLDALYIGPNDLSISLGNGPSMASLYSVTPNDGETTSRKLIDALESIRDAAHRHGKWVGLQVATGSAAAAAFNEGFDFVGIGGDTSFLASGCEAEVSVARHATRRSPGSTSRIAVDQASS
jgi:4-hydroxy-2-oxoheptanedioate aldolase